jgi:hypothetical protein
VLSTIGLVVNVASLFIPNMFTIDGALVGIAINAIILYCLSRKNVRQCFGNKAGAGSHHHHLLLWEFEKIMRIFASSNSSFLPAKWASRFLQSAIIQGAAIMFIIILSSIIISWWFNFG